MAASSNWNVAAEGGNKKQDAEGGNKKHCPCLVFPSNDFLVRIQRPRCYTYTGGATSQKNLRSQGRLTSLARRGFDRRQKTGSSRCSHLHVHVDSKQLYTVQPGTSSYAFLYASSRYTFPVRTRFCTHRHGVRFCTYAPSRCTYVRTSYARVTVRTRF